MINRPTGSFVDLSCRIPSAMRSEFGRVIENLMDVPGSLGAVLVDDDGYAIDYVYDPEVMDAIDVQLVGAQVGQIVLRLLGSASKLDVGTPIALLEGDVRNLMAGPVGEHYVLAFVLHRDTDVTQAFAHFEAVRSTVEHLLS